MQRDLTPDRQAAHVATIKSLEAKFGYAWVDEWLAGRGLNLNDYLEAA